MSGKVDNYKCVCDTYSWIRLERLPNCGGIIPIKSLFAKDLGKEK